MHNTIEMRAGKYKIHDKILCIKNRLDIDGKYLHVKGKKYEIFAIFDDINNDKIIELISELYNTQYCYEKNKTNVYFFNEHFEHIKDTRLKKLKKLKHIHI